MKRRFFQWVVKARRPIITVYLVFAVIAALCSQLVGVDYAMTDYLPADSPSTVALDVMEDEFGGEVPNARVMVRDVPLAEALGYKHQIEGVDGVEEVTWLDDAVSLAEPIAMQDPDTVETYYRDGCALFSVTIDYDERTAAVDGIREVVGDGNCISGSVVNDAVATTSTVSQIGLISAIAVLFVLLVLAFTTRSWAEPLLVMLALGVSVLLNNGSNLMFGTISFVTNAAGSILQLAIALDFSVFLLHRYAEVRGSNATPAQDAVESLCSVSTAIVSSACTITMGFLALCAMRFQIGPDLGLALAKGMVISLVTVMTFMPSLLVSADAFITKTGHRRLIPEMDKFGSFVQRVCVPLAVVFCLLPVPAYLASTSDDVSFMYGSSHIFGPETQLGSDTAAIEEVFGDSDTYVLLVPCGDLATEKALSEKLHEVPQITSVISYVDTASASIPQGMVDADTLAQLQSQNYSRMVLSVKAAYEGGETFGLVEEVRAIAQRFYPDEWLLAGEGVSTTDLMETISEDKERVDILAVAAVLLVLLLAMRSISLPVILVFVIETGIWLNFAVPYFDGSSMFYISYLITSTIQLGVTVDYAILLTDRYKDLRRELHKKEALKAAVSRSTVAILTSGIVLSVVGFLLSAITTHGILAQLGHFLGVGVLMSLFFVLLVLPGFLYVLDPVIAKTTLRSGFLEIDDPAPGEAQAERG